MNKADNCIFSVWNYKYNRFLPCEIVKKIDNKFVKVVEYHENDGEINTVVPWEEIKNKDKNSAMTEKENQKEHNTDNYCKENCKGYQETGKCFADGSCAAKQEAEKNPAEHGDKGRRGRLGGIPEHIRKKAEAFRYAMEPPYDADDICSAYETGAMDNCKPVEWSEEDEKRVKQLIYDTEFIKAHYEKKKEKLGEQFNNALIRDCDEQIAWLKSLPERFNLQPKQ